VSLVRITLVTFRRPQLLRRALDSIRAQTHESWTAEVVNDDPDDRQPTEVVASLGDPRITILNRSVRAGGAVNFNYAFRSGDAPYVALLEDDNWWEPEFLATMVAALERAPSAALITGNERVWHEEPGGGWRDSGQTLRPAQDLVREHRLNAIEKCGSAILCNSAVVYRPALIPDFGTPPSMPVDVTEHYRERLIPHPFLVHEKPLANFAVTMTTNRSNKGGDWTVQQLLLTASVFATVRPERRGLLSRALWRYARASEPLKQTTLLMAGHVFPEAQALWADGSFAEKARFRLHLLRHPDVLDRCRRVRHEHADWWAFLCRGAVADDFGRGEDGLG
jgi:glycosyltransferase involved in cell wall biosynthesis